MTTARLSATSTPMPTPTRPTLWMIAAPIRVRAAPRRWTIQPDSGSPMTEPRRGREQGQPERPRREPELVLDVRHPRGERREGRPVDGEGREDGGAGRADGGGRRGADDGHGRKPLRDDGRGGAGLEQAQQSGAAGHLDGGRTIDRRVRLRDRRFESIRLETFR